MEEEEASTAAHAGETIGYIAMQTGVDNLTGNLFEAGYTGVNVDETGTPTTSPPASPPPPLFLSNLTSYHGLDSSHLRYDALGAASVNIKLEEDTTLDPETAPHLRKHRLPRHRRPSTLFGTAIP